MRTAAAALLLLAACHTPPPPPLGALASLESVVAPAAPDPNTFGMRGRFRVVHASACDAPGGNPLVWPDHTMPPTAGQPLRVEWTTAPSRPYREGPTYLLLSFGNAVPIVLPAELGFPGCTLHVNPSPKNLHAIAPAAGSILTQSGGIVSLDWTPPAAFAGLEVNCQLVTHRAGGWVFSPGLELWVGSGR